MTKSIAIIGSGIAGLSAGIYARMNGFETDIYEMHSNAGGLCTSWKRKDYTFDGCIHWLTGSSPSSPYYRLWQEIGAVQGKEFFNWDYFSKIMVADGRVLTFYADPGKLEKELTAVAPEDSRQIRELVSDLRKFMKHGIPPEFRLKDVVSIYHAFRLVYKYRMSGKEFSERFTNPAVKELIANLDWHGMMIAFSLWGVSLMASGNAGYPVGGSGKFIDSVVERYINLGGRIHYRSKADKILVKENKAAGLHFADGESISADIVISAADGHSTLFEWLDRKYLDRRIMKYYDRLEPFPSLIYVCLGINADYSSEPHTFTFPVKNPFKAGSEEITRLSFKNYWFDPTLTSAGKSIFCLMIENDYEYWESLHQNPEAYLAEKRKIGEHVVEALSQLYPGIRSQVEVIDVATPHTLVRYTGNWKGSYEGWLLTKKAITIQLPQTLPGLGNFYMAGQWLSPGGGLPSGLITARSVVKKICKAEKIKFAVFT